MLNPHAFAEPLPPTLPTLPTLTVTPRGLMYIHASLRQALGLLNGRPVNLVPPPPGTDFWYLDLRPSARCLIEWHDNTQMKARGIILPPGLLTQSLTLRLQTIKPDYENWYPLQPINALTP